MSSPATQSHVREVNRWITAVIYMCTCTAQNQRSMPSSTFHYHGFTIHPGIRPATAAQLRAREVIEKSTCTATTGGDRQEPRSVEQQLAARTPAAVNLRHNLPGPKYAKPMTNTTRDWQRCVLPGDAPQAPSMTGTVTDSRASSLPLLEAG